MEPFVECGFQEAETREKQQPEFFEEHEHLRDESRNLQIDTESVKLIGMRMVVAIATIFVVGMMLVFSDSWTFVWPSDKPEVTKALNRDYWTLP